VSTEDQTLAGISQICKTVIDDEQTRKSAPGRATDAPAERAIRSLELAVRNDLIAYIELTNDDSVAHLMEAISDLPAISPEKGQYDTFSGSRLQFIDSLDAFVADLAAILRAQTRSYNCSDEVLCSFLTTLNELQRSDPLVDPVPFEFHELRSQETDINRREMQIQSLLDPLQGGEMLYRMVQLQGWLKSWFRKHDSRTITIAISSVRAKATKAGVKVRVRRTI
jgi:hypothetical protein